MTASERPSPNFDDRPSDTPIDMVVLHYTGMESAAAALEHLCDAGARVSAHYVIDEDGTVISLVAEDKRAWHAGEAYWRCETDINGRSVGVELVNPGHQFGYRDFPTPRWQRWRIWQRKSKLATRFPPAISSVIPTFHPDERSIPVNCLTGSG